MARSKVGGAFGFLRGSIGSVTYTTKKNSAGKREQVARQKAQQVSNPNSTAQIMQRMKLGPAQRFYDAFENVVAKGILSHAFEAVPYGSASRSHFISLAMKEESAVYVPKGVDFFVPGEYVVSEGSLATISYFKQATAEEITEQSNLLCDFNGVALTQNNINAFADYGYEGGMQLTLIGARAVANGRYEPFATRIVMMVGNQTDNAIDVKLYDDGQVVIGDDTIAAIAVIVSKGSQESNDFRSTQKMKFVNGFESLKSIDALQAAIDSYSEGYEVNSLNSEWYLNQDNGQAFNGRVEKLTLRHVEDGKTNYLSSLVGVQVDGNNLRYVIFTDDGTAGGKITYIYQNKVFVDETLTWNDLKADNPDLTGATTAKLTPEIAAQGGFTLGAA